MRLEMDCLDLTISERLFYLICGAVAKPRLPIAFLGQID